MSVLQQIRQSEQEKRYLKDRAAGCGGLGKAASLDPCFTEATQTATTESIPGTKREQTLLEVLEVHRDAHLAEVAKVSQIIEAVKNNPQLEGIIRSIVLM